MADAVLQTAAVRVVTLTLNPALDLSTTVERVEPWRKLRTGPQRIDPGGGGVNVARAVHQLGGVATAVVALGGHVGSLLEDELRPTGIGIRRVDVAAPTRQNFAVAETSTGQQYRFVQTGGEMSSAEWQACLDATVREAEGAHCVVASSSLPAGVPDDVFARLADGLQPLGVPLVVDTSGPVLRRTIDAPVRFVKPSVNELRTIVGRDLLGMDQYEAAARELLAAGGCGMIVVSLGADGALFVPRGDRALVVKAPDVKPVSSIGAGDSMVAALSLALAAGEPLERAARLGVAAGTAAVLAHGAQLCRREDVERLYPLTSVARYGLDPA